MTVQDIFAGGGILIVILTIIQIAPIQINPWGWLLKLCRGALASIGEHVNAGVMAELRELRECQKEMRVKLDSHIEADGRAAVGEVRSRILRFNNELLRDIRHTKEEYIDILSDIDAYESYCDANPDYPNNRAVLAIETIKNNYKERLQKHDFLESYNAHTEG